jgi:uncharacterized lipoprotein YehR (DUF1307 family)
MKKVFKSVCIALIAISLVIGLVGCNSPKSLAKKIYNLEVKMEDLNRFPKDSKEAATIRNERKKIEEQLTVLQLKFDELKSSDEEIFREEYRKLSGSDYY